MHVAWNIEVNHIMLQWPALTHHGALDDLITFNDKAKQSVKKWTKRTWFSEMMCKLFKYKMGAQFLRE